MLGKLFVVFGSLLLIHAGYYTVQCKFIYGLINKIEFLDEEYVKLAEVTDAAIPPLAVRSDHLL
jgi:hypothetical protein